MKVLSMVAPGTGHYCILLVDDDATGLMARQALLESRGYSVLTSDTESHALDILRTTPVDLVISDHYLRGTTGGQVAAKIKQLAPQVPVLVVSGAFQNELPAESLAGADRFLSKADGPDALLQTVASLIQSRRAV
jgi:CheY-like chemotaxis protein